MASEVIQRVAAFYDVHGNRPALDAALAAAHLADVDLIVFGGDLALGPMPREVLDAVIELGPRALCLSGNCDRLMVDAWDGKSLGRLPTSVRDQIVWAAGQLDQARRDFLAKLPPAITITIEGLGSVFFCHATPRSDEEIVTARTPAARIEPWLLAVAEQTVVCGHTHMQFDRRIGDRRLVNAGSVGMPYGTPGAHWLLLHSSIQPMRTDYDLVRAADSVSNTSYPGAREFADRNVLHPAAEEEMLALFEVDIP